ncbi:hypothetical protein [Streptomyces boluensis]|uniref:Uncharacterized protein n=1 Tax=Streptomyces boluensis TaxID=1775135 RepID=A0A964UVK6_9ACTN|nr:hypothetical protein [Streptomyces boluensis]NBE53702.1 hypothetical protein [Streptomyces boluensis]
MSSARHLHAIDLLCSRDLRAEHGPPHAREGPFHIEELRHAPSGDEEAREPGEHEGRYEEWYEQCAAELTALHVPLADRWGEPDVYPLLGVRLRGGEGELIPEPWHGLSWAASSVDLWHTGDRWLALAVTDLERPRLPRLLAVATDVDPP